MNKQEAKEYIIGHATEYLQRDKSGKGYVCPVCGSGTGKKGTGITTRDGVHYTCWAGCYVNRDIVDIIGIKYGLTDFPSKLERAMEEYRIAETVRTSNHKETKKKVEEVLEIKNYEEFYKESASHLGETEYLTKRGISVEVQKRFNIGYCEVWQSPTALRKGYNPPASPRIIIPTSENSYVARDVRSEVPEAEKKYTKVKEGQSQIFNLKGMYESQKPVFVVEGEIDALSLIEIGEEAIGLGSTMNYKKMLEEVREEKPSQPLLIALDKDKSGIETAEKLIKGLREQGIECYNVEINGEYKDANAHLVGNREEFQKAVKEAMEIVEVAREAALIEYEKTSAVGYLKEFINGIGERARTPSIRTGFEQLDKELDGGLYEGLYIIGAISSLGKTTFCLQVADQIAKSGQDVLIFSLEMARNELMAKSISRMTAEIAIEKNQPMSMAKSTRGITVFNFYKGYSAEEIKLIDEAVLGYEKYAKHIYISEGIGDIGVKEIREAIDRHIHFTGKTPVVVIDYLQIIAPYNERATDKQNTDKAVLELKRMSRDYKMAIIGISSFNRENYRMAVSMQAFKESGAIEYSSDVLIGLQLSGIGESGFDVDEAKQKNPREVELRILKNRNGKTGGKIAYEYYPQYNYFREEAAEEMAYGRNVVKF